MIYTCPQSWGAELGEAHSVDGVNWTRDDVTPAMSSSDTRPWETMSVNYPHVRRVGSVVQLWFVGLSEIESRWQIGYAERPVN